jgi:hypothetical protein
MNRKKRIFSDLPKKESFEIASRMKRELKSENNDKSVMERRIYVTK